MQGNYKFGEIGNNFPDPKLVNKTLPLNCFVNSFLVSSHGICKFNTAINSIFETENSVDSEYTDNSDSETESEVGLCAECANTNDEFLNEVR